MARIAPSPLTRHCGAIPRRSLGSRDSVGVAPGRGKVARFAVLERNVVIDDWLVPNNTLSLSRV